MKSFSFSTSTQQIIKFTIAIVFAMFVAKVLPINFAFIFPLFAGHFILFSFGAQPVSFYYKLFEQALIGTVFGIIIAQIALSSVLIFFVVFLCVLFIVSYFYHRDGDELRAVLYLVGIILIPIYALIDPSSWLDFSFSYITQISSALLFVAIINKMLPVNLEEKIEDNAEEEILKPEVKELPNKAWLLALVNTLATAPILAVTLYYDFVLQFLFLIYTCFITLQPQFKQASKHAAEYFAANIIGGALAVLLIIVWVFFNNLSMNQYVNLVLVIFVGIVTIALLAYKTAYTSFAAFVMTPFMLVIFSVGETWQHYLPHYSDRVYLIGAAGLYSFIILWLTKKAVSELTRKFTK